MVGGRDRRDLAARLAGINDAHGFALVKRERALLAELGDDETPVGISALALHFGDVEFVRGESGGLALERVTVMRSGASLPRPADARAVWSGDLDGADPFERVPLHGAAPQVDAHTGLLVARADAVPSHWSLPATQCVWTAGLVTWRKLAARGIWVAGSDDSLGETGAESARLLFPDVRRWLKLTHEGGYDPPHGERIATYRLQRVRTPLPVHDRTHFFWRSGSQFHEYLRAWPGLERAWHGCGPGNSLRQLQPCVTPGHVQAFLSAAQFRSELAA
jgi:hydroxymethylbilane synthase